MIPPADRVGQVGDFYELSAHFFAHVSLEQAGSLYDPAYIRWAGLHASKSARASVMEDAQLISRLWRPDPRLDLLYVYADLHADLVGFRATCARPLSELSPDQVSDPMLLEALQGLPAAELIHASLSLIVPEFEAQILPASRLEMAAARAPVEAALLRLDPFVQGLARTRVDLCWALGRHGRSGYGPSGGRVVVGAPAPWNALAPARVAVLAAHEHLVAAHPSADYFAQEWGALVSLAVATRRADPQLQAAHRTWLAELDLSVLVAHAQRSAWVDASLARTILAEPLARAWALDATNER